MKKAKGRVFTAMNATVQPYVEQIRALRRANQDKDADAIACHALQACGDHEEILLEYALNVRARGDWETCLQRAERLYQRFPNAVMGYQLAGLSLARLNRFAEADVLLANAMAIFPKSVEIAVEYAQCAKHDDSESLRRWTRVHAAFPGDPLAIARLTNALRQAGRLEEGSALIRPALDKFPNHLEIGIAGALMASAQERWSDSLHLWEQLKTRFPNNDAVRHGYGYTVNRSALAAAVKQESQADTAEPTRPFPKASNVSGHEDLMTQFESLGENCEFGIVQRHFGAEPLGLLRWTSIGTANLIKGLKARFEGLGEPQNTVLSLRGREYMVHDKVFGLAMHTFIEQQEQASDILLPKMCGRLKYLKSELIKDLAEAAKIFVYKSASGVSRDEADAIAAALRLYGKGQLLVVSEATEAAPPGTLLRQTENILFGYVEHFSTPQAGWKCAFDTWLAVCKLASAEKNLP